MINKFGLLGIKIENNIITEINRYLLDYKGKNIIILCGRNNTFNIATEVAQSLSLIANVYIHEINDNSMEEVLEINKKIIFEEFEVVLGIGGGKVLDVAKYVAYVSRIVFVAIPTSLAHDGVASPISVIKVGEETKSLGCVSPQLILVDKEVIQSSPVQIQKAGIGDILSNYTATYDWKLANKINGEKINDFAITLSEIAYNSIINHKDITLDSPLFVKELAHSIILSGLSMDIAGSSRPCSGSEHLFSHSIDQIAGNILPHGIQVAIGSVMSAYMQGRDYKNQIRFLKQFEIPFSPLTANLSNDLVIEAWLNAKDTRKNRFTILNLVDSENPKYFKEIINKINRE